MSRADGDLADAISIAETDTDVFRSTSAARLATADARGAEGSRTGDRQRVFGGQLLAQALSAACRTVPATRFPRSLHAYFIAGADADRPLDYVVDRVRDGRSVSHRRVDARQADRVVLSLEASFDEGKPGFEFQDQPAPGAGPDELADATGEAAHLWSGIQIRFAEELSGEPGRSHVAHRRTWIRVPHPLDGGLSVHACALAFMSDLTLIRTALLPDVVAAADGTIRLASLDHAMWFHRPVRADDWLAYESVAPAAHGTRALTMGHLYDQGGRLAVTVVQQGTVRVGPTAC